MPVLGTFGLMVTLSHGSLLCPEENFFSKPMP